MHRRHSALDRKAVLAEKKAAGLWVKFWVDDGIADRSFLGLHLITSLFADWFLTKHSWGLMLRFRFRVMPSLSP